MKPRLRKKEHEFFKIFEDLFRRLPHSTRHKKINMTRRFCATVHNYFRKHRHLQVNSFVGGDPISQKMVPKINASQFKQKL